MDRGDQRPATWPVRWGTAEIGEVPDRRDGTHHHPRGCGRPAVRPVLPSHRPQVEALEAPLRRVVVQLVVANIEQGEIASRGILHQGKAVPEGHRRIAIVPPGCLGPGPGEGLAPIARPAEGDEQDEGQAAAPLPRGGVRITDVALPGGGIDHGDVAVEGRWFRPGIVHGRAAGRGTGR